MTRRLDANAVLRWSNDRVVEAWNELRADAARAGWRALADLPETYRWNCVILEGEIARRFRQLQLF